MGILVNYLHELNISFTLLGSTIHLDIVVLKVHYGFFPETKIVVFTIEEIVDFPLEHSSKADILFSKWHFSHLATYKRSVYDPEIHRCVHDILISLGATC